MIDLKNIIKLFKTSNSTLAIAHSINLGITFFMMPILLRQLGVEIFAIYSVFISTIVILGIFDFGISSSYLRISQFHSDDKQGANSLYTNYLAILTINSIILLSLGVIGSILLSDGNSKYASVNIIITTVSSSAALFGNFVNRLRLIHSNSWEIFIWTVAPSCSWAIIFSFLNSQNASASQVLSTALSIPGVVSIANYINYRKTHKDKTFIFHLVSRVQILTIIKRSRLFFLLQLSMLVSFQVDTLIAAKFLYLEQVSTLTIGSKLVGVPIAIVAAASLPIWGRLSAVQKPQEFAEAILRTRRLVLKLSILSIPVSLLSVLLLPKIIISWTDEVIKISTIEASVLTTWLVIASISQPIAMTINGLEIRLLMKFSLFFGTVTNLFISVCICSQFNLTFGTMIGSIIAQIFFTVIPFFLYSMKKNQQYHNNNRW
jgi:O-antigen/teichoic acid export membrane protein